MYKIFINDHPLFICKKDEVERFHDHYSSIEIVEYSSSDSISAAIAKTGKGYSELVILSVQKQSGLGVEKAFKKFSKHYKTIEAAGGLVTNTNNEVLLIFRRGFWDLPKGKIDKGELASECAIREVIEETGINQIVIKKPLTFEPLLQAGTLHTYHLKGKPVLKLTYWYHMICDKLQQLKPQSSEDIEQANWIDGGEVPQYLSMSYGSIRDVWDVFVQRFSV